MSARPDTDGRAPAPLSPDQQRGADPQGNRWMSASAGTGKTQVLTSRILRLLLDGVSPCAILAITFTKAGASEMARRIREKLAKWVQLEDGMLRVELKAIGHPSHDDPAVMHKARTLFATVIDAPGRGLAIQTIHSFCQSLLAAFPDEAGLAPGFRPLEERQIALLKREVLAQETSGAVEGGNARFVERLQAASLEWGEGAVTSFLYACADAAEALDAIRSDVKPWLRGKLGLALEGDGAADCVAMCSDDAFDIGALRGIAAAAAALGGKNRLQLADGIADWLASGDQARAGSLAGLLALFLTGKGELRAHFTKDDRLGAFQPVAEELVAHFVAAERAPREYASADMLADAVEAGRHFARAYVARKRREGLVDFDDLIRLAARLLDPATGLGDWIRFKLDQRIDHILVDEAQDTNEAQWSIIKSLTDEFFVGEGVKGEEACRTLFVVGDYKQAIYGFQGTSPENFNAAFEHFRTLEKDGGRPVDPVDITQNFRSSPPVLEAVDAVVATLGPEALGLPPHPVSHVAFADRAGGSVVLWPPEPGVDEAGAADDEDAGDDGDDKAEEGWIDSASRRVANRIARQVQQWIATGLDGEPVRPGDVMVLVRKRAEFAALLVTRMQAHGVPVAGVDRLRLHAPIAVQDLLAAARFALQPLDDLSLASLLVSPLMGWSHAELAEHGWRQDEQGRSGRLWPHLRQRVADGLLDPSRIAPLEELLRIAGFTTPHIFFETILSGAMQGRAKLTARLGNAAIDPVEELLNQALAFQTQESASLQRFLQWFDLGDVDVKRESDDVGDEVRVMTVHGSKGLQARIVILADACADPDRTPRGLIAFPTGHGDIPLPYVRKDICPTAVGHAMTRRREADLREHWRLLYVAMTRAERHLFVAGALSRSAKEPPRKSWHSSIATALEAMGAQWHPLDDGWGRELAWRRRGSPERRRPQDALMLADIPGWVRQPAPEEPRPLRPLAPSQLGERDELSVPLPPPLPPAALAAERGRLMHALFERLPPVAPAERRSAGARWLARHAGAFDAAAQAEMLDAVLAVLADPAHAHLFGGGSLAEVPFSALVEGRVIAGAVDRLLVTADHVHILDFKTGGHVPAGPEEVPPGYVKQMAAYAAAIAVVFPGRAVTASLLFTSGPRLVELPAAMLDANKPGFDGP
jgi:ATP-dependent helicase/nuclease subunit A